MLEDALRQAVEVIKTWHNMDGSDVWDIYYRNAPEMRSIRDALAAPPRTDDDVFSEALGRISGGSNGR